jgi:phosphatidate cytidylyltransferase
VSITRVLSALVLIVVFGGTVLFLPPVATVTLAAVAAAVGGIELARLARPMGVLVSDTFVAFSAAAFCILLSARFPTDPINPETIVALMIGLMVAAGLVTLATTPPGPAVFGSVAVMLLAPLYVGLPLGAMAWIRDVHGPAALIWLVAVIALSDTAQYYAGNLWGHRKLAPVVSPKKTVEGAIGGFVVAPLAGAALATWALPELSIGVAGLLALGLALVGMAGDLFESLLKRSVGAKDSSALIPGHGGVLDRVDAYLFAAPTFYLFLRYIA